MKAFGLCMFFGFTVLASAGAVAADTTGGSIYTCIDAAGRKLTSDRPIAACVDRTQRELGPMGNTRRIIGPTLTEQERAYEAALARKEQDARDRVAEERRRDRVMVSRYPDKAAHDAERTAALETSDSLMKMAKQRDTELESRSKALAADMEFYKRDPNKAPMHLRRDIAQTQSEMQAQERQIAQHLQDKKRVHDRFDKELARLRDLWAQRESVPGVAENVGARSR